MFGINDPSALLRPWRNLQQFSEELYAMFSKGGGQDGGTPGSSRKAGSGVGPAAGFRGAETPGFGEVTPGLNAVRKVRLEAARGRVAASEASGGDSHATRARTPQAGQQEAARERPKYDAGVPAETPRLAGPAARPKTPEALRTTAEAARRQAQSGDHAATRRRADQTDHAEPIPPLIATTNTRPAAGRAGVQGQPGSDAASTPPDRAKASAKQSRPHDAKAKEDFGPNASESKPRPRREGSNFKELDIGEFANQVGSSAGGTTVFMGKVVSGTGDTYEVTLYQQGPSGDPDSTDVEVTIPMIDPSDSIPAGTWLSAIFQFTDDDGDISFSCQPPVWMA